MSRLLTVLSCCLICISFSILIFDKKKVDLKCDVNPGEAAVSELTINSLPFSNVLVNYTNTGLNTQAGAINCVVVSSTDSNLVLAGAQNGGVWISHNAAHTWQPVNDTAATLCVTSIAQNFFRPNEFYYSTGIDIHENGFLLFDIYRSTDFGQTFSVVHPATFPSFGKVSKILTSSIDSNTIYVLHNNSLLSGPGSVYRTTDNCNTFQLVYQTSNFIDDMVLLPNGTVEIGFSHSVWRSTTGNSGTFVQSTGINATGYDTHLAFCQSQPGIQYCSVFLFGGYDFYKSIDTGQTWTWLSTQGSMFFGRRLAVKPDDPDFVLTGSMGPSASVDGGLTWQYIIAGHDLRSFNFDPHRPGKVYVTSDFGISTIEVDPLTSNSFNMEYRHDSSLYSQEIYYGDHAATGFQTLQGCQDLGSRFIQNMTQSRYMLSGDGEYSFISKQNPDVGYFSAVYGDIYRADHMTTTSLNPVSILNQLDSNHDHNVDDGTMWVQPFMMNNANDSQLYFPTFHWLWRSTDRGTNWIQVSRYTSNSFADVTIACTHKPNPIVYWTHSDSVFVLANAATAAPFSEFGRTVPFDPGRSFEDPDHDSALYILNRSVPSRISYCANLFDINTGWTDIPTSLLAGVTIQCMAVYPGNDQVILAGSKEGGLYVTLNKGLTWTKEIGMPNVQITEIKIRESDKKVFIFTYGRGTWTADFASLLPVSPISNNSNVSVYPNPFQDYMTIEFDRELNAIVELKDTQGRLCLKKSVSGKQIKISTGDLVSGVYLITVFSGNKIVYQAKGIRMTK
jgi:hypothetical protein